MSPVVRKIAREHHVDVRNIAGSGEGGRVTKNDILAYIDAGSPVRTRRSRLHAAAGSSGAPAHPCWRRIPRRPPVSMRRSTSARR